MTILITGAAGFIGFHLTQALLARGETIIGIDNLNNYYAPSLKQARLDQLKSNQNFDFYQIDIADHQRLSDTIPQSGITSIVHLAAQAGVRYSLENPFAYANSNLTGQLSMLELARSIKPRHFLYASSSSVYGANDKIPFSEEDRVDQPVSLYGATKKADEAMSSAYARLYQIPSTGFRFFTVYGPWGRPDMAYWIFTEKMLKGESIDIFNQGKMGRDFTFIDDIVAGLIAAIDKPPSETDAYHRVFNLGNESPEELMTLVSLLEKELGIEAIKNFKGMQKGDVERTWANIDRAKSILGYAPKTPLAEGIAKTIAWRKSLDTPFI